MLEIGRPVQALAGLVCLDMDRRENEPADDRVSELLETTFRICGENYLRTRQYLAFWRAYYTDVVHSGTALDRIHPVVYGDGFPGFVRRMA